MATRTLSDAGGNWDAVGTWDEGIVPTSADDVISKSTSGNLTVNQTTCACKTLDLQNYSYTGLFTISSGMKLTVTGAFGLRSGMTVGGTGILALGSTSATIYSGGLALPWALTLAGGTKTLGDNWDVNGAVSIGASTTLNGNTMNIGAGLSTTASVALSGTTAIVMDGTGTISSYNASSLCYFDVPITINTAGTITIGTCFNLYTKTFTYTAGTVVTTSSTLYLIQSNTLNTNGITWNKISFLSSNKITTLQSNLNAVTIQSSSQSQAKWTFAGAYDINCDNFIWASHSADTETNLQLVAGQTLSITTLIKIAGLNDGCNFTVNSSVATTHTHINFSGTAANTFLYGVNFTDIDASGSSRPLLNWHGGTLTRCTNIYNITEDDLPAVADVWTGVSYANGAKTGTKRASSITNCSAGNVKSGVVIDDVTGSYSGGGSLNDVFGIVI